MLAPLHSHFAFHPLYSYYVSELLLHTILSLSSPQSLPFEGAFIAWAIEKEICVSFPSFFKSVDMVLQKQCKWSAKLPLLEAFCKSSKVWLQWRNC